MARVVAAGTAGPATTENRSEQSVADAARWRTALLAWLSMRDRRIVLPHRGCHVRDCGLLSMALGTGLALTQQDANDDRSNQDQYPHKVLLAAAT